MLPPETRIIVINACPARAYPRSMTLAENTPS